MSQQPLSLNITPENFSGFSVPGDKNKKSTGGFEALLNLGGSNADLDQAGARENNRPEAKEELNVAASDPARERSADRDTSRSDGRREAEAIDTRVPRADANNDKPVSAEKQPQAKEENTVAEAGSNQSVKASGGADGERVQGDTSSRNTQVAEADAVQTSGRSDVSADVASQLQNKLFAFIAQFTGAPVTDVASAQAALQNFTVQSPAGAQLATQLQSVLGQFAQLAEGSAKLPQGFSSEFSALLSRINGALYQGTLQQNQQGKSFDALVSQLQQFTDKAVRFAANAQAQANNVASEAASTEAADVLAQHNQAAQKAAQGKFMPQAEQVAFQAAPVKSDVAAGQVAAVQNNVKAESSLAGGRSGGFDFSGGQQQQSAALAGARVGLTATNASQQSGTDFARLLQQTNARPVVEQIAFQIRTAPQAGTSKITIQLSPAELGKVDVKMDVDRDGKTSLTITTDNKGTFDMLQRDRAGLERALADAGLKADSGDLNFNLRGEGQGKDEQEYAGAGSYYPATEQDEPPLLSELLTKNYTVNLADGIDIKA